MIRRVMVWATLVSICVLCAALWHVLDAPVRGFVIQGELTEKERGALRRILAAQELDGILSTSLEVVRLAMEALPWAREVSVRRQWPDRFIVTMHKANPVARWGDKRYLSAFGDLLVLPDEYSGLPRFDVTVSGPVETMEVYRLLDQIASREGLVIRGLQQNAQAEWSIEFSGGGRVLLGAERLNERMHRFLLIHRRILKSSKQQAEYVDARYASGVAVRYHQPSEKTGPAVLVAAHGNTEFVQGNR